ncbi:uncharacterized protein LOC124286236 [Haliotis rubra]|uniref:uncharacterized protein LOC124286236 n=1 Tax=Haliotis rubra TaxID=36100 RepID=UPI001EE5CD59|nr:uncharacterized protein LOC124286236 [Haliotis rubra]
MATVVTILGFLCSTLSVTFNAIAIATPHWLASRGRSNTDIGVFRHCNVDSGYCGDMDSLGAIINSKDIVWFRTVQATLLLGCVGSLLGLVMSFLYHIRFFESHSGFKSLTIVNIMTLSIELVAVVLFGLDCEDMFGLDGHTVALDWSFHVAILALCFIFLSIVLHAMEASRAADLIRNMQHRLTVWTTPYTLFVDQDNA